VPRIELRPVFDVFTNDEIADLEDKLKKLGAPKLSDHGGEDVEELAADLDGSALEEFKERLAEHDVDADMYLPIPFNGSVDCALGKLASAQTLLRALLEMRSDLELEDVESDEAEDDETPEDADDGLAKQQALWRLFSSGANRAVKRRQRLEVVDVD
jgi:hypothetical protein